MPASRPSSSAAVGARVESLTLAEARRAALRAQGVDRPRRRPSRPTVRHLARVVDQVGLLQIDSVNVLARAHLVPVFSRIGPYDVTLVDRAAGQPPRRLVEAWAHEASYVPPATYRLLGWRRRRYRDQAWGSIRSVPVQHADVTGDVRDLLADYGPLTAREVHAALNLDHVGSREDWGWNWGVAKRVLEYLFFTGEVASARRNAAFERCYDLAERVLPQEVLAAPEPSDDDAVRGLLEIGARAHGVGSVRCFADYFRLRGPAVTRALGELVEDGTVRPVRVVGWDRPTYLHRDAVVPRSATGARLLSPFDPVVWERRRLEELFGMHYRIEIYVPAERRVHGYYVLPFLLGERFAARVDLRADRAGGVLEVLGAFTEPDSDRSAGRAEGGPTTAEALAEELRLLVQWVGLGEVRVVGARGDLVPALTDAVRVVP
jgi:uncharacterized protein